MTDNIDNPIDINHEVEKKLYLLKYLGLNVESNKLELSINKDANEKSKSWIKLNKKNIIINLGGSLRRKKYPVNKLVRALFQIYNDNTHFILIGDEEEIVESEYLSLNFNQEKISYTNLVNKINIKELIAVINRSDLYLGNDSGAVHIAAAVNKPIIEYICESVEKTNNGMKENMSLSAVTRFRPWSNQTIILQPEKSLGNCKDIIVHGGCGHIEGHCITQISVNDIVNAYNQFIERRIL